MLENLLVIFKYPIIYVYEHEQLVDLKISSHQRAALSIKLLETNPLFEGREGECQVGQSEKKLLIEGTNYILQSDTALILKEGRHKCTKCGSLNSHFMP